MDGAAGHNTWCTGWCGFLISTPAVANKWKEKKNSNLTEQREPAALSNGRHATMDRFKWPIIISRQWRGYSLRLKGLVERAAVGPAGAKTNMAGAGCVCRNAVGSSQSAFASNGMNPGEMLA